MIKIERKITRDTQLLPGDIICIVRDFEDNIQELRYYKVATHTGTSVVVCESNLSIELAKKQIDAFFLKSLERLIVENATYIYEIENERDFSKLRKGDVLIDKYNHQFKLIYRHEEFIICNGIYKTEPYHQTISHMANSDNDFKLYLNHPQVTRTIVNITYPNKKFTRQELADAVNVSIEDFKIEGEE